MPSSAALHRLRVLSALAAGSALLAACGGGGGTSSPPPPPPPAASLSIKGTAAKGAAIAGATVDAKCNGGSGTATTAADGTYTITLTAGSLPCVLKVTTATGDLYSVATGTGTTVTANITPFTQLIVADLAGKDPAAYFTGFGASDIAALTPSAVTAAQTAVVTVLANNGINTSALPTNLVSGSLVAANGSTTGNAYDQALDALNTKLTGAGTTLTQLTTTVVQTATSTTTTPPSGTPSVALDVALQPAAATCSALRSGTYRIIQPQIESPPNSGSSSTAKATIVANASATTAVVTNPDATTTTLTAVSGTPCRFSGPVGTEVVVSQAGVVMVLDGSTTKLILAFPEQSISVADMAGDWNVLGYDRANTTDPLTPWSATIRFTAAGALSFTSYCADAKTCAANTNTATLVANSAGGFDFVNGSGGKSRVHAYRAGGGEMIFVGTGGDGTIAVGTRMRTLSLPTVGTVNQGWGSGMTNNLVNGIYDVTGFNISDYQNTIASVDTANNTFVRNSVTNFTANPPITRPETFTVNQVAGSARNGYNYRKPEAVVNSNGANVNVLEFIQLPLRGMGMTVIGFPAPAGGPAAQTNLQFSVAKP